MYREMDDRNESHTIATQEWKGNNQVAVSRIVVLLMEDYPNYSAECCTPRLCKKGKCFEAKTPQSPIFCCNSS